MRAFSIKSIAIILSIFALIGIASCSKEESTTPEEKQKKENNYTVEIKNDAKAVNGVDFTVTVNAVGSSVPITKVELFMDGTSLGTAFSSPATFNIATKNLVTGNHELVATASTETITKTSSKATFIFVVNPGDDYQGGVVIKITDDGIHGVIASKHDLTGGASNTGKYKYGAYNGNYGAYDMDDGLSNTKKFEGKFDSNYAAIACLQLDYEGYSDWYLPAYNELLLFDKYRKQLNIPERGGEKYWSSTGSSEDVKKAYLCSFGATTGKMTDIQTLLRVRPCRRF